MTKEIAERIAFPGAEDVGGLFETQGGVCPICGFSVEDAGEVLGVARLSGADGAWLPLLIHEVCYDLAREAGSIAAAWDRMDKSLDEGGRWRAEEAREALRGFLNAPGVKQHFV